MSTLGGNKELSGWRRSENQIWVFDNIHSCTRYNSMRGMHCFSQTLNNMQVTNMKPFVARGAGSNKENGMYLFSDNALLEFT